MVIPISTDKKTESQRSEVTHPVIVLTCGMIEHLLWACGCEQDNRGSP